jgi:hypothetical protein
MNDTDARQVEEELHGVLRDVGLGWVVEQVEELALEGRFEVQLSKRGRQTERYAVEQASDTRRGATDTRPYTSVERLVLLIEGAEAALRDAAALELAVRDDLLKTDVGVERLQFVDEAGEVVRQIGWTADPPAEPSEDLPELGPARQAADALERLRQRVDAG